MFITKKEYQVKINEIEYTITDADIDNIDLVQKSETIYHLINNHASINIEVIHIDVASKLVSLQINGVTHEVLIQDSLDVLLNNMGFNNSTAKQIKQIKAPMPGMVMEVVAHDGQSINEGDKILILEAMKMENSIMSPTKAVIKKIMVKAGMPVDKGTVLVELE